MNYKILHTLLMTLSSIKSLYLFKKELVHSQERVSQIKTVFFDYIKKSFREEVSLNEGEENEELENLKNIISSKTFTDHLYYITDLIEELFDLVSEEINKDRKRMIYLLKEKIFKHRYSKEKLINNIVEEIGEIPGKYLEASDFTFSEEKDNGSYKSKVEKIKANIEKLETSLVIIWNRMNKETETKSSLENKKCDCGSYDNDLNFELIDAEKDCEEKIEKVKEIKTNQEELMRKAEEEMSQIRVREAVNFEDNDDYKSAKEKKEKAEEKLKEIEEGDYNSEEMKKIKEAELAEDKVRDLKILKSSNKKTQSEMIEKYDETEKIGEESLKKYHKIRNDLRKAREDLKKAEKKEKILKKVWIIVIVIGVVLCIGYLIYSCEVKMEE